MTAIKDVNKTVSLVQEILGQIDTDRKLQANASYSVLSNEKITPPRAPQNLKWYKIAFKATLTNWMELVL